MVVSMSSSLVAFPSSGVLISTLLADHTSWSNWYWHIVIMRVSMSVTAKLSWLPEVSPQIGCGMLGLESEYQNHLSSFGAEGAK